MKTIHKAGEQSEENPYTFVMSSSHVDRVGDVVVPDGIDIASFKKNLYASVEKSPNADYDARFVLSATTPDMVGDTIDAKAYHSNLGKKVICLFGHDHEKILGYWDNLEVKGNRLVADLKLAGTNLARMVKELLLSDVPLSASIGFSGRGEPNEKGGIAFSEVQIHETSIVAVGCHPSAMRIAKSFGVDLSEEQGQPPIEYDNDPAESGTSGLVERKQRAVAALNHSLEIIHK